jgi:hypothetical protein
MDNKIANLIKQNQAIYNSLQAKNIEGLDELITEPNLELLTAQNNKFKELSKATKTVHEPKQKAVQPVKEEDEDEIVSDPLPKFTMITNMEDIKRAFFSGDYELFTNLVNEQPFRLYQVKYKYESDKDGCPDFSAKNLIKGFIRNFDDFRKYFMICFRCFQNNTNPVTYSYPSLWIVNSNDSIDKIIGSLYEDFEFTEYVDKNEFINNLKKMDEATEGLISEGFVH